MIRNSIKVQIFFALFCGSSLLTICAFFPIWDRPSAHDVFPSTLHAPTTLWSSLEIGYADLRAGYSFSIVWEDQEWNFQYAALYFILGAIVAPLLLWVVGKGPKKGGG